MIQKNRNPVVRFGLRLALVGGIGALGSSACSSEAPEAEEAEPFAEAQIALAVVPSDTSCIQITATGSRTVSQAFTVTPGASSVLQFSQLPVGSVAFSGEAFGAACDSVVSGSPPNWVADPVSAVLAANTVASVALSMRRVVSGQITVDFVEEGGSSPPGACSALGDSCGGTTLCCSGLTCGATGHCTSGTGACSALGDSCGGTTLCCSGLTCGATGHCTSGGTGTCAGQGASCSGVVTCCSGLVCTAVGLCG